MLYPLSYSPMLPLQYTQPLAPAANVDLFSAHGCLQPAQAGLAAERPIGADSSAGLRLARPRRKPTSPSNQAQPYAILRPSAAPPARREDGRADVS